MFRIARGYEIWDKLQDIVAGTDMNPIGGRARSLQGSDFQYLFGEPRECNSKGSKTF